MPAPAPRVSVRRAAAGSGNACEGKRRNHYKVAAEKGNYGICCSDGGLRRWSL